MSNQMTEQAIVVSQAAIAGAPGVKRLALFNPDGSPYAVPEVMVPMTLEGYEIAEGYAPLASTDTVVEAFGKLERHVVLEDYVVADEPAAISVSDTIIEALGKLEKRLADAEAILDV